MSAQARRTSPQPKPSLLASVLQPLAQHPAVALFFAREVSVTRVAMGSGRMRLARMAGLEFCLSTAFGILVLPSEKRKDGLCLIVSVLRYG